METLVMLVRLLQNAPALLTAAAWLCAIAAALSLGLGLLSLWRDLKQHRR